ncbi:MAG TPA: hybrid sensor histidine kinase/response regulator [Mariprofundaceae bacterium]|nr:hybrid sensor histidine kinase/response regulator [Mariprofundaceae bacterium]
MSGFDLSQFLSSFFDEARERLTSINRSLVRFEAGSLDDEGMIALRRDAHTIKGSALMLGVQDVGDIGHLFEDAMEYLIRVPEARNAAMVQFLFDLHDQLEKRLQDPEDDFRLDVAPLKNRFEVLKAGQVPESEASSAPVSAPVVQEPMIGAEEAQSWRHEHQGSEGESPVLASGEGVPAEFPNDVSAELSSTASIETSILKTAGMIAHEGALLDDMDNFKPDVSQVEMRNAGQRKSSGQYLRVDAERLNQLSNQIIELSTEKAMGESSEQRFAGMLQGVRGLHREWSEFANYLADWNEEQRQKAISSLHEKMDRHMRLAQNFAEELRHNQTRTHIMLDDLRDQVLGLMLRPLSSVFSTFPRSVRDIAVRCGKKVNLLVGGESVEMDRAVAETLVEPLVHLLNNAVSHGIESPEVRRGCGKPEEGQVTILAKQSGSEIVIEVVDDGQGLDADAIRKSAVEKGVTTEAEASQMDTAEILELIFRPGFSTRDKVDDVSGRGIGMNVVQDTVRKLTGSIRIHSEVGKGTRFVLSLPVSIAIQQALQFRIGDQRLGLLTHMIEQVVPLHKQTIERGAGNKDFIRYAKHMVPLVDLRESLLDPGHEPAPTTPYVIIAEHIEGYVGILVDETYDEREVIVREVDPYLKRYQTVGVMGNTINADGSVLILIEPYGIKEMGRTAPTGQGMVAKTDISPMLNASNMRVLLVDDSIIARKVETAMIERLGFKVDGAIDGIDAREKMHLGEYDILVTDLEMPRLDGFGLVRQLRNESKFEDIPILVISTRESPEDRMRAIEAGADAYLVKQQLSSDTLINTLQALIGSLTDEGNDSTNRPPEKQAPIV